MQQLLNTWNFLNKFPLGNRIFSLGLRFMVPYTGSLGAIVQELRPGHCRVLLKDRRAVRNHLNSIHAMALANLAEMTSGLSLVVGLPKDHRAILVGFEIQYMKKSRGQLVAISDLVMPPFGKEQTVELKVVVQDSSGATTCQARASWKIGIQA